MNPIYGILNNLVNLATDEPTKEVLREAAQKIKNNIINHLPRVDHEEMALIKDYKMINAIKIYRERVGCSLMEARFMIYAEYAIIYGPET